MERKSFFLPVLIILSGVFFQMHALGLLGAVNVELMLKAWPAILIAAALDMFFCQHRTLGSLVLMVAGVASIALNVFGGGVQTGSDMWNLFIKFWPILLILFGLDSLLHGKGLLTSIIAVAFIILIIYAVLTTLGVPVFRDVSGGITSIAHKMKDPSAPAAPYSQTILQPAVPQISADPMQPIMPVVQSGGAISYAMPSQPAVGISLDAVSGKIQLASSGDNSRILSGEITLDAGEILEENANQSAESMVYFLVSQGSGSGQDNSLWDMKVSPYKSVSLKINMNNGYEIIDLRGLNLIAAEIGNVQGNIDVMLPEKTVNPVRINAGQGDIRVYIPSGVTASFNVSGTESVTIPSGYNRSGTRITANNAETAVSFVPVEIMSAQRNVQIIQVPK